MKKIAKKFRRHLRGETSSVYNSIQLLHLPLSCALLLKQM